jgi:hypothetical protein
MGGQAMNARSSAQDRTPQAQSGPVPLVCEKTFAGFCESASDVDEAVLLRLVEGDMRLLRIASARARRNCAAMAQEANALALTADALGLFQASGLARQLEGACLSGDHAVTYGLIGRLSEVFQVSGATLEALLRRGSAPAP